MTKDFELVDGLPVAYIKSIRTIAVADLHLGYEGVMAKKSTLLPKANLKSILKTLDDALTHTGASSILVDGDIKNEFSKVDQEEFNEMYDLVNFAKERGVKLILVKGNHDNFVERYKDPFKLTVARQEIKIGGYLFFHGEELPRDVRGSRMLVMGHEHPAIGMRRSVGARERLRCFLYGKYEGVPLVVLPAMNYFAAGTEINNQPVSELLSPVFRHVDVDSMHAIALGYGETIDFGAISELRGIEI